uniref:G-protein coupled receptors family 1 profile domain-containing protein n=1 Tax=Aotus nancymaae TaxID=37293 RepID=A0A2K5D057_AOTNA
MWNTSDANSSLCYHESVLVSHRGHVLTLLALAIQPKSVPDSTAHSQLTLADLLYCTLFSPSLWTPTSTCTGAPVPPSAGYLALFLPPILVSILTLCLIALGRYLLIAHPKLFPQVFSAKGIVLALVGTWVIGVASFAPLWPIYILVPVVCTCSFDRIRGRPYTTILMGIYFVLGLSSVGIFYCLIHRQVKRAAQALDQYKLRQASHAWSFPGHHGGPSEGISSEPVSAATTQTLEGDSSEVGDQINSKIAKPMAEKSPPEASVKAQPTKGARRAPDSSSEFGKVTRMCFAVFLCFALSYIPLLLLNILDARVQAPRVVHMLAANLTWLNGCINPVLYAAMNANSPSIWLPFKTRAGSFRRLH